ncbi:hypothetical protein MG293_014814 [Ovis ammon polii]|uniref:Uncharacterized protein n=1 Tax=Ovis ammon polii TaxID=230172 RepID=A0AAD4Y5S4_OVIAM|nr:hypothetical protein MG293_014814 [Ovis ammon polii]
MIQISEGFPTSEYQETKTVNWMNLLTSQEKQQGIFISQKQETIVLTTERPLQNLAASCMEINLFGLPSFPKESKRHEECTHYCAYTLKKASVENNPELLISALMITNFYAKQHLEKQRCVHPNC